MNYKGRKVIIFVIVGQMMFFHFKEQTSTTRKLVKLDRFVGNKAIIFYNKQDDIKVF